VNPKDPKNGQGTIDNPFGKPTGKVATDTNKVKTEPGTVGKDGYYVVAEGDNLYKIAKKFNPRIDVIVGLNNLQNMNIDKGQRLKVVDDGTYKDPNPVERTDATTGVKSKVHVVRQGENLWEIARRYKTTTTQIQKLNNMNTDKIDVRQELIIEIMK
jgi:membrane-bound lytic murein transglycosylase D